MIDQRPEAALGRLIREARAAQHMSSRALAAAVSVPQPTVIRLETGQVARPNPQLLAAIAEVLDLATSELYAIVGYTMPSDLPALSTYLRTKYRDMPGDAQAEIENYVNYIQHKYGMEPSEPRPGEDE